MTEFERFHKAGELDVNFLNKYDDDFQNFLKAIHKSDEARLRELLSQPDAGSKVNKMATKETALHLAVRFGSLSLVKQLIDLGANVNAKDSCNRTPLYSAIKRDAEMVQTLLDKGAEVKISDQLGVTPLQQSLISGSMETANLIVNHIYNLEQLSNKKEPPQNDVDKCRRIVDNCLSFGLEFIWNEYPTLLQFVAEYGDEETFNQVLTQTKNINVGALNPNHQTLFHFIINTGKTNLIKQLLDNAIQINQEDSQKKTLLHYAIMKKDLTIVNFLLDNGADIHQKDSEGFMPISYALRYENIEIVRKLLELGADINEPEYENYELKLIRFKHYTERNLTPNPMDDLNFTPFYESLGYSSSLCLAVSNKFDSTEYPEDTRNENINWTGCSSEMIKFLIENGAQVQAKTRYHLHPISVACRSGRLDVVKMLLDHGAEFPLNAILYGTDANNTELAGFLIYKGANVFVYGTQFDNFLNWETPLLRIANRKSPHSYVDMIECLADNKASVNENDVVLEAIEYVKPEEMVCLLELIDPLEIDSNWLVFKNNGTVPNDYMNLHQITAFLALQADNFESVIENLFETYSDSADAYNYVNRSVGNDSVRPIVQDVISFSDACKSEIEKLTLERICDDSSMSYFQFLSRKLVDLAINAKDEVIHALNKGEYKKQFPCYAFLIEQRTKRVRNLRSCLDKIENYYEKVVAKQPLAFELMNKIFSKWSVGDIRNFARALSPNFDISVFPYA